MNAYVKGSNFIPGVGRHHPLLPGVVEALLICPLRIADQCFPLEIEDVSRRTTPDCLRPTMGSINRLEGTARGKRERIDIPLIKKHVDSRDFISAQAARKSDPRLPGSCCGSPLYILDQPQRKINSIGKAILYRNRV